MDKSPLAPENFPAVTPIDGVEVASVAAGIKYQNRADLAAFALAENSKVAAVYTRSKTASAAVQRGKTLIEKNGNIRGFVVNSGNANAFTGAQGDADNQIMAKIASEVIGCQEDEVLTASTGVIGEPLNVDAICQAKQVLAEKIKSAASTKAYAYEQAAQAIMTTDTFAKGASIKTQINGKDIHITGIAKGSGMIAPDMATMLGFIFTDANIEQGLLQAILKEVTNNTFNCITVDSDTSTSDTVLLAATGKAYDEITSDVEQCIDFIGALTQLMRDLAIQIVKDGEGASKFITINVIGAQSDASAKIIAMAIANSPLVKTAVAGEDANWGRVVAAIGKAGEPAERDKLIISMGGIAICAKGQAVADYDESKLTAHLKGKEISIDVDLQIGDGKARVWTCDFTEKYIQINADYRS